MISRRRFAKMALAGGTLAGLGDMGFLSQLRPVSAAEAKLDPPRVQLDPEIEPLVRLLENTPRDKHGAHSYDAADFGIDLDDLHNRFRFYNERFGVA